MNRIVIVTGGRSFNERAIVDRELDARSPIAVISGGASGADTLAEEWARQNEVLFVRVPAQWRKFGRPAGPLRNRRMLSFGKFLASAFKRRLSVLAFPGGAGTSNCVRMAREIDIEVEEIRGE